MPKQKIVILMGSASDASFARRIEAFLQDTEMPVSCEYRVSSAHRNPAKLLADLTTYERSNTDIVYVTVAGLSDALSGVVAGSTKYPVIACPPDGETRGLPKIFSSVMTPKGIAVSYVPKPENAALAAAKILALSSPRLTERIEQFLKESQLSVGKVDAQINRESGEK